MPSENFDREARREFAVGSKEIASGGVQKALVRFYRRHDKLVSEVLNEPDSNIACRSGCSYCCYIKVTVKAVEVHQIVDFVNRNFKPEHISSVVDQAKQNVEEAKDLTHRQHLDTNQRCHFLVNDTCSIYPVRPTNCRNMHAMDVEGCKKSFENPNEPIPTNYNQRLHAMGNGASTGFRGAVEHAGFDNRIYDLNSAFLEALENPRTKKRLNKKKKSFLYAKSPDVDT